MSGGGIANMFEEISKYFESIKKQYQSLLKKSIIVIEIIIEKINENS